MAIIERSGSFGVQAYVAGQHIWVDTYPTREEAEQVNAEWKAIAKKKSDAARRKALLHKLGARRSEPVAPTSQPKTDAQLYRCFNDRGQLLYVGITSSRVRRFFRHAAEKDWWTQVAQIKLEHFPNVKEAREAEKTAIRREKPRHNKMLAVADQRVVEVRTCRYCQSLFRPPYKSDRQKFRFTWCGKCELPAKVSPSVAGSDISGDIRRKVDSALDANGDATKALSETQAVSAQTQALDEPDTRRQTPQRRGTIDA